VENLNELIGDNLKRLRAEQNLSLDALAKLSGVSKSMLGQIERGEANPSISTVWRIAKGLRVTFTALMDRPHEELEIIRRDEIDPLVEGDGVRNYPMFSFDAERGFEMYTVDMEPRGYLQAEPHTPGSEEFISVAAGTLSIRIDEEEYALRTGDSIRFRCDVPHAYHNDSAEKTRLVMVIRYPRP